MSALLEQLERESPHLRAVMANALRNVRPTHLLDRDVLRAWAERPEDVRPKAVVQRKAEHHRALPMIQVAGEDELGLR
jgi:tRNA 2-thiocytidine biosynthesis protein TtcA